MKGLVISGRMSLISDLEAVFFGSSVVARWALLDLRRKLAKADRSGRDYKSVFICFESLLLF